MLRSDLCDFNDSYTVVEGTITVAKKTFVANNFVDFTENRRAAAATTSNTANEAAICFEKLAFWNNAPFVNSISKINGVLIDKAEDLDGVMPIYNLLEYSKNYKKTTDSLWSYYRD